MLLLTKNALNIIYQDSSLVIFCSKTIFRQQKIFPRREYKVFVIKFTKTFYAILKYYLSQLCATFVLVKNVSLLFHNVIMRELSLYCIMFIAQCCAGRQPSLGSANTGTISSLLTLPSDHILSEGRGFKNRNLTCTKLIDNFPISYCFKLCVSKLIILFSNI